MLYSDDDGVTWQESNVLRSDGKPLMEPGVAECADGSVYMTIRTATGVLYEARSRDGGATWADLAPTKLPSPAAPSTVVRAPGFRRAVDVLVQQRQGEVEGPHAAGVRAARRTTARRGPSRG